MKNKMMKLAVWGLGKHAINNILPACKKSLDIELFGVYTRDELTRNKCAKNFDCRTWQNQYEMLDDPNVNIIYLSTPPALHYQSGIEILTSGKHFWCEKPFTTNLENTQHLIEVSEKHNLTLAEGCMYLHHPQFLLLKEQLKMFKPNEIKLINSTFTLPFSETPGFRYNKELGGSTLLDIGTYPLSIILHLIEDEQPQILLTKSNIDKSSKVDMSGLTILKSDGGTICNLFWGMGFGYRNEIDILTTKGSIYSDKIFSKKEDFVPKIFIRNNYGDISNIESKAENHFILMLRHFYSLISDSKKAQIEKEHILNLSRITEEIKIS